MRVGTNELFWAIAMAMFDPFLYGQNFSNELHIQPSNTTPFRSIYTKLYQMHHLIYAPS